MTSAGESYDAFPYPSHPFSITHPNRLHVLGRLLGLDPAPVEGCRVLELGCASGGNLLPIAADLPGTRCVGIDASRRQVDEGRAHVEALGLKNCELIAGDIAALGPELGTFDYIICHGVYSWVPRHVQDAILAVYRRSLAPHGVGYVSYNTYPGWRMRSMIRDMMRYHARQFDEPRVAVEQSRRLLDYLAKNVGADRGAYAILLQQELTVLRRQSDAYLFHEHLEADNEPLYLHQLVERLEAAGLAFLGEASLGETRVTLFPNLGEDAPRGSPAAVQADQYRDFVINRSFRTTLVCHRERELRINARVEEVPRLLVAARLEKAPPRKEEAAAEGKDAPPAPEYTTTVGNRVRVHAPAMLATLEALDARWPRALAFDELVAEVRARAPGDEGPDLPARLAAEVLQLYADDHVELRVVQPRVAAAVSPRPAVSALSRRLAEVGSIVVNARHEPHEVDRFERELVRACDGTRDLPALIEVMVQAAQGDRLEVTKDGVRLTDPAGLREVFEKAVPARLRALWRRSLLVE